MSPSRPDTHAKGEWPFPAAAQPGDKNENLDESSLTPGERVTDTSTKPDGGNPKAVRGTFELTGDRGHEDTSPDAEEREQLSRDAADQMAQAPNDAPPRAR